MKIIIEVYQWDKIVHLLHDEIEYFYLTDFS